MMLIIVNFSQRHECGTGGGGPRERRQGGHWKLQSDFDYNVHIQVIEEW